MMNSNKQLNIDHTHEGWTDLNSKPPYILTAIQESAAPARQGCLDIQKELPWDIFIKHLLPTGLVYIALQDLYFHPETIIAQAYPCGPVVAALSYKFWQVENEFHQWPPYRVDGDCSPNAQINRGVLWNYDEQEAVKGLVACIFKDEDMFTAPELTIAAEWLAWACYSRSVQKYSKPDHPPFKEYLSMLNFQYHWQAQLPAVAYEGLRGYYGQYDGVDSLPEGRTEWRPGLKSYPDEPEIIARAKEKIKAKGTSSI